MVNGVPGEVPRPKPEGPQAPREFPLASPTGIPSGKGLYLTVYPLSRPNTDTIYRAWISNIGRVKSQYTSLVCRKKW